MRISLSKPGLIEAIDQKMAFFLVRRRAVACLFACLILAGTAVAEEGPKPATSLLHRELWVPAENLEAVLKSRPRAVTLSAEQYQALIRDAVNGTTPATPEETPPAAAVIRDASFEGTLGNEVVRMTVRYTVECFTDEWSEIPLSLPRTLLAHIEVDDESALRIAPPPKQKVPQPVLAIRGKGRHSIVAEYHLPVLRSPTGNAIQIVSPGVPTAKLTLNHQKGVKIDSSLPFRSIDGSSDDQSEAAEFVLPAQPGEVFEIRWTARTIAAIPDAAVFQTCRYLYSIDSTRIQADLGLVLSSSLAELPGTFSISVPEGVRVLSVEGSELLRWTREANGALSVVLTTGKRQAADLRVLAEADMPAIPESDDANKDAPDDLRIALPIVEVEGIHRASGTIAILGSDDVRVKNILTGPLTVAAPEAIDPTVRNHPEFVTGFRFPVTTAAPEVTLSPVTDRFSGQMDTRIELKREAIHLTRQLTITPMEGRIFSTELILSVGEELVDVIPAINGAPGFEWNRLDGNRVRLSWREGLVAGDAPSLTITSRRDPEGWFTLGETPLSLNFINAGLPNAEAVSGYVAVAFDESFRVETITADGMEARDGRTTPITGPLAWFRLSDYSLELNTSRRATEIEATVTAYALPLQSALEIEGQLDLNIRYSPISEIVVSADPTIASQLRFDSPLLAEKRLDAETGAWTLAFHDEQIGFRRLRYRMVLPFEMEEADDDSGQKHFAVDAPALSVPAAKRLSGDWIIEANTDTELNFNANGLDVVDSLRVPLVDGYQPRHRVIAAFQYRGDAWKLEVAGTRHAPEELVSTVIDSLRIDTVVSTDGDDRHQAMLLLRTSGEQFLEIGLPKNALVWTLTVDGEAVKPVRAEPGTLRVQLPAREGTADAVISLKVVYQTPGREWGGSGSEILEPIRLAERIPVMRSQWLLHLPEGYDYQKFRGNLREEFQIVDRTLLGQMREEADGILPSLPMAKYGYAEDSVVMTAASSAPVSEVEMDNEVYLRRQMSLESKAVEEAEFAQIGHGGMANDIGQTGAIEQKLKSIIIPNVEFTETPLKEAIAHLQSLAREADPTGRGVNIQNPADSSLFNGVAAPNAGGFSAEGSVADTPITLKLTNVPLAEALRYTAALSNLKTRVDASGVTLVPLSTPDQELVTNVYRVPSTFLNAGGGGMGGGGAAADPFAAPAPNEAPDQSNSSRARQSAKNVLENFGITFGPGASASYDPQTGQLVVRNSKDQMELVDAVTEPIRSSEIQDKIPMLGDIPAVGQLFRGGEAGGGGAQAGSLYGGALGLDSEMGELVDSESGERIVVWADDAPNQTFASGGTVSVSHPLGRANDLVLDEFVCENIPLSQAIEKLEAKAREAAAAQSQPTDNNTEGGFAAARNIELALDSDGATAQKPVSFSLKNITLGQALAKITGDTGTEFRTTASGVVIAQPSPIPADQLMTLVLELPNSAFEAADGNGGTRRQSARNVLTDAGIEFPAGTSAAYNFSTGRLAVRNTSDNLERVREKFSAYFPDRPEVIEFDGFVNYGTPINLNGADMRLKGFDPKNAGLIPIDFALPESGRSYGFTGLYAPEPIQFRYVNWERQVRFAWIWMLAGGLAFWFGAVRRWNRPVIIGVLGVLVLTFTPLILSQSLLAFCNGLLIGWLVAAALWLLWRICDRASLPVNGKAETDVTGTIQPAKPKFF